MNPANLIGRANGVKHLHTSNGNTRDIINAILYADKFCAPYTANAAAALKGRNVEETCYNIWKFWKDHVRYVEDPDGVQYIKSPGYLMQVGHGDCKSYSVAAASILQNLRIPYKYRFITEDAAKDYHHVYVVVPTAQGEIIIDCVLDNFNVQNAYAKKKDIAPQRSTAAGINGIGATQAEVVASNWLQFENIFKEQVQGIATSARSEARDIIESKWKNRPVIKKRLLKVFDNSDLFNKQITASSCLIYLYWDNSKATYPIETYNTFYGPPAGSYAAKLKTARDFRQDMLDLGFSDALLRKMCQVGTYNAYGISMDYMLYKCYSMVNYGQPWEPVPGIPYFDFKTGTFVNTGNTTESLDMTVRIASCFPARGGISVPWGVPYWSIGGYYIQNGMDQKNWDFIMKNPGNIQPATDAEKARMFSGGAEVSKADFAQNYELYWRWLNGNMPSLPSVLTAPGGQAEITVQADFTGGAYYSNPFHEWEREGGSGHFTPVRGVGKNKYSIGWSEALTAAVIAAVVSIITTIASIVANALSKQSRGTPPGSSIAQPPPDFKFGYNAANGCVIGTAPNECPGQKAMYCPDGTFQCVTDADIANNPGLQPGMPANGFLGGMGGNKWLLLGGAALIFMGLFSSSKSSNS